MVPYSAQGAECGEDYNHLRVHRFYGRKYDENDGAEECTVIRLLSREFIIIIIIMIVSCIYEFYFGD